MHLFAHLFLYYGMYFYFLIFVLLFYLQKALIKRDLPENIQPGSLWHITYNVLYFFCGALISYAVSQVSLSALTLPSIAFVYANTAICVFVSLLLYFLRTPFLSSFPKFLSSSFIHSKQYGLIVFLLLCFQFIQNMPQNMQEWSCWSYAANYSMGFGSRFMVGQWMTLIFGDFIPSSGVYLFCIFCYILLFFLVSILVQGCINRAEEAQKPAILFLISCFLFAPDTISSMSQVFTFGRLDTYILILSLCSVLLFSKIKNLYVKYAVLSLVCILSMAIYHGFVFMFFPIVFTCMAYDSLKDSTVHIKNMILSMGTCLITAIVFFIFQFMKVIRFADDSEMIAALKERTDLPIVDTAIQYEYFRPVSEAYRELMLAELRQGMQRGTLLLGLMLRLPLVILIVYLFAGAFRRIPKKQLFYSPLFYSLLSLTGILPQFLLNVDWGRWRIAFTINVFFILFYSIYTESKEFGAVIRDFTGPLKKNYSLAVSMVLFLSISNILTNIYQMLTNTISWLH